MSISSPPNSSNICIYFFCMEPRDEPGQLQFLSLTCSYSEIRLSLREEGASSVEIKCFNPRHYPNELQCCYSAKLFRNTSHWNRKICIQSFFFFFKADDIIPHTSSSCPCCLNSLQSKAEVLLTRGKQVWLVKFIFRTPALASHAFDRIIYCSGKASAHNEAKVFRSEHQTLAA